jgi:hypothetical protein
VTLNADKVGDVHCVLAFGADGFHLRDLGSPSGTYVNGQPFTAGKVGPEDLIAVGPFHFLVLPATPPREALNEAALEAERDALRIQAAAVVAQQAALADEESRLRQRRSALERQKTQLADHLEQRRHQLLESQEQHKKEKEAFQAECEAVRREQEQQRQSFNQAREEVLVAIQSADKERTRLIELRKRLKRRWRQQFNTQMARLAKEEKSLASDSEKVRLAAVALHRDRARFVQDQLRFNGEAELTRRQLRDEWEQLGVAQQEWEAVLNTEQARRSQADRDLQRRVAEIAAREQSLAESLKQGEERLGRFAAEANGLESRIANLRRKLEEIQQEQFLSSLRSSPAQVPPPTPPFAEPILYPVALAAPRVANGHPREVLEQTGALLADQRLHIIIQWQSLLEVEQGWQAEHAAGLAALEAAADELQERDRRLTAQEQILEERWADVSRRQHTLFELRSAVEGCQALLTARQAAWEAERSALLADVQGREEVARAKAERFENERQQLGERVKAEVSALVQARAKHEQMRSEYVALWKECQETRATLAREQRDMAARALALETMLQESLNRLPDPPAATRRLERLQRRHAAQLQAESKALEKEQKRLAAEARRLDDFAQQIRVVQDEVTQRQEAVALQEQAHEEQRDVHWNADVARHKELQHLRAMRSVHCWQIVQLRDEVERIARFLMEEPEPPQLLLNATNEAA